MVDEEKEDDGEVLEEDYLETVEFGVRGALELCLKQRCLPG